MRVGEAFTAQWTVCWITTYTFDPGYFETFLLRRLGEPPLNVTVLADAARLARTWDDIDPAEVWRVRRANRDYLVRGIALPGGAFHAKTILLGNGRGGALLVGSGNVTLGGLDQGREVFSRFDWANEADHASFGAWRTWMEHVVVHADDAQVRARWADLLGRLTWLPTSGGPPFVTNWDEPLLEQFVAGVSGSVEHLIGTAPFFDADVGALRQAIDRTRPREITVLVGDRVSVRGRALRHVLETSGSAWHARRFLPRSYVHAKLLVALGDGRARVLAGSANLSGPALLRTASTGGNAEAGVIVEGTPEWASELLGLTDGSEPLELDELDAFELVKPAPEADRRVRLHAAFRLADGRVEVETANPVGEELHLAALDGTWLLRAKQTVDPVAVELPCFVWLADDSGPASNRVPLDDRHTLATVLNVRADGSDRPAEVDVSDLEHPLGALLAELYRSALFSIDETPAAARAEALRGSDVSANEEFWDTFLRDQIRLDPRHGRYAPWRLGAEGLPPIDDFRWLIEQMILRTPPRPGLIVLPSGETHTAEAREQAGKSWTPSARLAVSTFHVLGRWADALSDPRVRWHVAEYAPVDHYERLVGTIVQLWAQGEAWFGKPEHYRPKFIRLLERLWTAFVGGASTSGYLRSLELAQRGRALELLKTGRTSEIAAGLAFAGLVNAQPERFFAWQSFLVPALQWGVVEAGPGSAAIVPQLVAVHPTLEAISDRLAFAATYTDDEHWAARIQQDLAFVSVKRSEAEHPAYRAQLQLEPGVDLLHDPRVVALAREALRYRSPGGVRITSGSDVLVVGDFREAVARAGQAGTEFASAWRLSTDDLEALQLEGAAFDSVLHEEATA